MNASCYLGIDFGTSGARACLIDADREILWNGQQGFQGVPADPLAQTWRAALFDLLADIPAGLRGSLASIAVDGTSATVLLCDEAGTPLLPPLLYDDARAASEMGALKKIAPPNHITLSATSSLAKLFWYSHEPAFKRAACFLHQADWLSYLLHGKLGLSDYNNCLKLGFDPGKPAYPEWLVTMPHFKLLPRVGTPGEVAGSLLPQVANKLDINPACQIHLGTTDSVAAFRATRQTRIGQAVTALGSTLALKLLSGKRMESLKDGIYSHRYGDLWLAGGASNTGGQVLKKFFTETRLEELSQKIDPSKSSGLNYYPLLKAGERFPVNDPNLQPRLAPRPGSDVDFLHGLLEGIARIEAKGYQRLAELGAGTVTSIMTMGGGARNDTWTKIRQQILGLPVQASPNIEAAYGAALFALT